MVHGRSLKGYTDNSGRNAGMGQITSQHVCMITEEEALQWKGRLFFKSTNQKEENNILGRKNSMEKVQRQESI